MHLLYKSPEFLALSENPGFSLAIRTIIHLDERKEQGYKLSAGAKEDYRKAFELIARSFIADCVQVAP